MLSSGAGFFANRPGLKLHKLFMDFRMKFWTLSTLEVFEKTLSQ